MDQTEFLCETCGSPHVSIPDNLQPDSKVVCGRCGAFVASWEDYCGAISLALANDRRTRRPSADPVRRV